MDSPAFLFYEEAYRNAKTQYKHLLSGVCTGCVPTYG